MKKLLLGIILLGAFTDNALAQKNFILSTLQPKSFVNLTVGYSRPGWTPFCKGEPSYMGEGQSASASYGYRIGRLLGVVGTYSYVTNTVLKDAMINSMPVKFDPSVWQSTATNCTMQSLMAGPMISLQNGRFLFDFQVTAGYARGTSSRMELNAPDTRPAMALTTPSQTTQALAAGAGATIRYKLNRWLAVQGSAHYLTANLKYDNLIQEITIGPQQTRETMPSHQPVGMLNLGGGLSILF